MVRTWYFGQIRGPTMVSNLPTLVICKYWLNCIHTLKKLKFICMRFSPHGIYKSRHFNNLKIFLGLNQAYQSMANLQSSLNSDEGLGTASLATIYITIIISCLFLPSIMIKNIGLKWTIVISQICYLLFIAANMYPKWFVLIPGMQNVHVSIKTFS